MTVMPDGVFASDELQFVYVTGGDRLSFETSLRRAFTDFAALKPNARLVSIELMAGGAGAVFIAQIGFNPDGVDATAYPLLTDSRVDVALAGDQSVLTTQTQAILDNLDLTGFTLFGFSDAGAGAGAVFAAVFISASTIPPAAGAVEQIELIPRFEGRSEETTTEPALDTYVGAAFWIDKPVDLNRIAIRISGLGIGATGQGRFAVYQDSKGCINTATPLVANFDFDVSEPPAAQNFVGTPAQGTLRLVEGICFALWGRRTGAVAFDLVTYNVIAGTGSLLSMNMVAGTHPTTFTTGISAGTLPATLNPLEGGGDVTGVSDDLGAVWRTIKV